MVVRRGFTLIEIILVLVVLAILSAGTFKAIEAIYTRSAQAKAMTDLSLQSQIVLDQLSILLYNRIPNSVIGYDANDATCEPIGELSVSKPILEWLAIADDELLRGDYDGFVDMNASWPKPKLIVPGNKMTDNTNLNLIFAGTFDGGSEDISACYGAFGWHTAASSDLSFDFNFLPDNNISITDVKLPEFIYEKYYLTNTAYAVARGADVNVSGCTIDSSIVVNDNTLLLFYNYYPYKTPSETFCGDGGVGDVTVLAQDVTAFSAQETNNIIRLSIDMQREIRGKTCGVHVSKQKAVF
ncbi:type II secretion system protein [Campylobacterota bacterium]